MRGRRRVGIIHGRAGSAPRRSRLPGGCSARTPARSGASPEVASELPSHSSSSETRGGRKHGVTALLSRPPPRGSPLPPFTSPPPPQYLTPPLTLSWFGRSALSSLRSGRRGCCGGRSRCLPETEPHARLSPGF